MDLNHSLDTRCALSEHSFDEHDLDGGDSHNGKTLYKGPHLNTLVGGSDGCDGRKNGKN